MESQYPQPPHLALYGDKSDYFTAVERPTDMQPPEPPASIEGAYSCFGVVYTTEKLPLAGLDQQGITDFSMDTADLKVLLKQLNRQLLEQFMYIIRQLVECPLTLEVEPLINDVKMTALNIFHATNRYRPSQAVDQMVKILQQQQKNCDAIVGLLDERTQECLDAMQLALKSSDAENLPRSPLDAAGEYRLQPLKVSAASQSIQPMREALTEI